MKRIGIYGGTFDPVHRGHLLVAQAACEELDLDRLFFVPAAQSPFKPESRPTPGPLRARMLRLALAGETRFEVDTSELDRGGVSYTIDTARLYRRQFPETDLYYLIGADHVPQLPKWREASALADLLRFVAIPRPGEDPGPAEAPFRVQTLQGIPFAVSSSEIRARVRRGLPVYYLTPSAVAEVIRHNRLYL